MNAPLIIFFVLAAMAVVGALSLILQRHPIHSALSLIVVMVALAGLYLLMGAEFVAAVQIIVYGGAIMVLFVFVIMLLNAGVEERTNLSKLAGFAGIPLAVALTGFLAAAVARSRLRTGRIAVRRHRSHQSARQSALPGFRLPFRTHFLPDSRRYFGRDCTRRPPG
jgi:NADH:ubiquinone oxidoreductase subunit 6 (subunit J)